MTKGVIVASIVVIAGAAYVGSSWYVGQQAEAKIRASIEQTNQEFTLLGSELTSRGMQLSVKEYKRGIFSADAVYALTLNNIEEGPVELTIADHLQHGPFPLDTLKAGDFTPMLAYSQAHLLPAPVIQAWFDSQEEKSPMVVTTRLGMDGTGSSVWTLSSAKYIKDGSQIRFSGGQVTIDFSNDFKDSVSTGRFDSFFLLDGEDASVVSVDGLKLDSTAQTEGDKSTLNSRLTMDKLILAGEEELTVDKVAITMDSQQTGKLLDGSIHYQLGRLATAKTELGTVDVTFAAKNLDMVALTDMVNTYEKIHNVQGGDDNSIPELTSEQQDLLQEKLFVLLAAQPTLSARPVVWKNSAGKSTASLSLNLAAPTDANTVQEDPMAALTQMLKKLQLDVNVSRSMFIQAFSQVAVASDPNLDALHAQKLGVELFDQYVGTLKEKGVLKVIDDNAVLALGFQDGKVQINGQEMPVEQFLMLMMMLSM